MGDIVGGRYDIPPRCFRSLAALDSKAEKIQKTAAAAVS
jgi:hypothetical protein